MKKRSASYVAYFLLAFSLLTNISYASEIKVYDKNEQFLGILLDGRWNVIVIFIPSLNLPIRFDLGYGEGCIENFHLSYESDNCSGSPYVPSLGGGNFPYIYSLAGCLGKYYVTNLNNQVTLTPKSMGWCSNGECACNVIENPTEGNYYGLTEIESPFAQPIVLPLRYEYISEDQTCCSGDLNNNCVVDGLDLSKFAENYGKICNFNE